MHPFVWPALSVLFIAGSLCACSAGDAAPASHPDATPTVSQSAGKSEAPDTTPTPTPTPKPIPTAATLLNIDDREWWFEGDQLGRVLASITPVEHTNMVVNVRVKEINNEQVFTIARLDNSYVKRLEGGPEGDVVSIYNDLTKTYYYILEGANMALASPVEFPGDSILSSFDMAPILQQPDGLVSIKRLPHSDIVRITRHVHDGQAGSRRLQIIDFSEQYNYPLHITEYYHDGALHFDAQVTGISLGTATPGMFIPPRGMNMTTDGMGDAEVIPMDRQSKPGQ